MYVHAYGCVCVFVHDGPQSVGGQQQQKSRHFNVYRDHIRLCFKYLFLELIICFFYSIHYPIFHYKNQTYIYNGVRAYICTYLHL